MSLTGTVDAIDLSSSALLNPTGSMSIAMWVKQIRRAGGIEDPKNKNHWLVSRTGAYDAWVNKEASTQPARFRETGSGDSSQVNPPNARFEVWKHVTITIDASSPNTDQTTVYVNGALADQASASIPDGIAQVVTNTFLGSDSNGDFLEFYGLMDDVAFFDYALSPSEIRTIMTGDFSAYALAAIPSTLTGIAASTGQTVEITFGTVIGQTYDVQFTADLPGGTWTNDPANVGVAGTGTNVVRNVDATADAGNIRISTQ